MWCRLAITFSLFKLKIVILISKITSNLHSYVVLLSVDVCTWHSVSYTLVSDQQLAIAPLRYSALSCLDCEGIPPDIDGLACA